MAIAAHVTVMMADLSQRPAAQLQSDDALREAMTGIPSPLDRVTSGPGVGVSRLTCGNGIVLDITEDHPILTEHGFVPAGSVQPETRLVIPGGTVACSGNERLMGDYKVYELELRPDGPSGTGWPPCIIANGVVVRAQ